MKCKDCNYYSIVDGTIFCDSRNHKRRTVRIDNEDAEKDIECKWADNQEINMVSHVGDINKGMN